MGLADTPVAGSAGTSDLQFSHMGLHVTDLPRMARFYREALRFTQTDAGDLGTTQLVFLSRDPAEHHQLVLASGRPPGPGFNVLNQISFRVPGLDALRRFHQRLVAQGATDVQAVTHGNAISIYCRDPEGNRLELFFDTPWYCEQPIREPVDWSLAYALILARAVALARPAARFQPRHAWQAALAERMAADQRG